MLEGTSLSLPTEEEEMRQANNIDNNLNSKQRNITQSIAAVIHENMCKLKTSEHNMKGSYIDLTDFCINIMHMQAVADIQTYI